MRRSKNASAVAAAAAAAVVAGLALTGAPSAVADPGTGNGHGPKPGHSDVRNVGPDYNHGKAHRFSEAESNEHPVHPAHPDQPVRVGQVRTWLAQDDYKGSIYLKPYKLRGIGDHIEVWVAKDTSFPKGDCRNDLGLTDITDAQVNSFIHEFDSNIYPKEATAFTTPPNLDGSNARLPKNIQGLPRTQFKGDGDNIVVLVDNVRDANYYDPSTPDGQTYIAGFFWSYFNDLTDRNIMTIDAYDWLHRTGANPPDDTADPAYVQCAQEQGSSRPYGAPRPHTYEGTFAHEYQHLLESYQDPDEVSWVNEGLSDWVQTEVGYVDPTLPPDSPVADSHLSCFMGYQPESFGGPENSLTLWGDQGGPEILCDYGAAYSFMSYLHGHYGDGFMTDLHKNPGNGLEGLDAVFQQRQIDETAQDALHTWAATMALDDVLDRDGTSLKGGDKADYVSPELDAKINWDNPQAYDSPGAPPNGSDYVRFRIGQGASKYWLPASKVQQVTF
ncbi:MAG: peptidase M6, partial [Nocardioidaceae bacterium]